MDLRNLTPSERLVLAVDTSEKRKASDLLYLARDAGAETVKLGLELSSATSWEFCSGLAHSHGMQWIADAKLCDIPNTVVGAVKNICNLFHPPVAITMHASGGVEMMAAAQDAADELGVAMLAVTVLTSLDEMEVRETYHLWPSTTMTVDYVRRSWVERSIPPPWDARSWKVLEYAEDAHRAAARGVVCAPTEVRRVKDAFPNL